MNSFIIRFISLLIFLYIVFTILHTSIVYFFGKIHPGVTLISLHLIGGLIGWNWDKIYNKLIGKNDDI